MRDDLNPALAVSDLFVIFKNISRKTAAGDKSAADDVRQVRATYSLLGLFKKDAAEYLAETAARRGGEIPERVKELAAARWNAKAARNWAEADALRAEIDALGYAVKDSKDGYTITEK